MFAVPWFERVWCIQEAQLPSSAIIMWGEQEIPQTNVYLSAAWINQRRAKRYYTSLPHFQAINWSCALNMFDISKLGSSILEILVTYREFQATDSRDMVYALLNLMKPDVVAKKLIRVDYRRSAADVYADVAIAVIYELSDLEVLSHVRHFHDYDGYDGFTSWAPRWDIQRKNNKLPLMGSLDTGILTVYKRLPVCFAAGLRKGSNILRLRGLSFHRVSAIKTTMSFMSLLDVDEADANYPIADVVDEALGHYSTLGSTEPSTIARVLARTLTAGLIKDDHGNWLPILTLSEDDINKHYCGFVDYVDSHFPILYQKYAATFDQLRVPEATSDDALRYAQLLALVCDCRRLFYTSNGSYGLGPACMREGDLVVIFFGGDTPYVLRPKGEGYLFLGQAYVDELMQGKLVDDEMEAGRVNEEDFCLL
jgi:hypothetical protein